MRSGAFRPVGLQAAGTGKDSVCQSQPGGVYVSRYGGRPPGDYGRNLSGALDDGGFRLVGEGGTRRRRHYARPLGGRQSCGDGAERDRYGEGRPCIAANCRLPIGARPLHQPFPQGAGVPERRCGIARRQVHRRVHEQGDGGRCLGLPSGHHRHRNGRADRPGSLPLFAAHLQSALCHYRLRSALHLRPPS